MSSKKRSHLSMSKVEEVVDLDPKIETNAEYKLDVSQIANIDPYSGMKLEIRDADYIWSSGFIVSVEPAKDSKRIMVTVASDGWGREWDEVMEWPNDRLARLYTYTKHVKCNLDLLRKVRNRKPSRQELDKLPKNAKRVYSTMWPVSVQFRMPHPGVKHARDSLKLEDKVFVKPYGIELLPKEIQQLMIHDGGCWLHHSRLRIWRDDPNSFGVLHENYQRAFILAQQDESVKGFLYVQALEHNSLLKEVYRSNNIQGCKLFDGVLREAKTTETCELVHIPDGNDAIDKIARNESPSIVAIHDADEAMKSKYSKPPKLPPPMVLTDPLYPNSGVSKCRKSNKWTASVSMNANQVFLGSFPTESQAWMATRKATGEFNVELPKTLMEAQLADLQAVSMETIIDTYEAQYNPAIHNFSLHDWTVAKINHYCYMREKLHCESEARQKRLSIQTGEDAGQQRRRSKGQPRKIVRQGDCGPTLK